MFSRYQKLASLCLSEKIFVDSYVLKRCYSSALSLNSENENITNSSNTNSFMQLKKKKVLKMYGNQLHQTSVTNYLALKLFLMRDVGIDPVLLADLAQDSPEIYHCDIKGIEAWVKLLLGFSFERNQIIELIQNYPWLLLIPAHKIAKKFHDLLQQIEIARLELPLLCCNAPSVLTDEIDDIMEKHLYFHFIMAHRDFSEVAQSGAFNFPMQHIKLRHQFLHRRGQYLKYSRHGSSKFSNPPFTDVFCSSDEKFCEVANCDLKEYRLFEKLFEVEFELEEKEVAAEATDITTATKNDLDEEDNLDKRSSLADELAKHL